MRKTLIILIAAISLSLAPDIFAKNRETGIRKIKLEKVGKMSYVDDVGARQAAERAAAEANAAKAAWQVRKAKADSIPNGTPIKNEQGEIISFAITSNLPPYVAGSGKEIIHFVPVKGETAEDLIAKVKMEALFFGVWVLGILLLVCLWVIFRKKILNFVVECLDWASDAADYLKNKI